MTTRDLSPQEGKTLRYVISVGEARPTMCVSGIPWSDLPRTPLVARAVLERLRARGMVERSGKGYQPTEKGRKRIRQANKAGQWRAAPPRSVTNQWAD